MCLCLCMRVCLFFMPLDIYYHWRTILVVDSDEIVSGMTFTNYITYKSDSRQG